MSRNPAVVPILLLGYLGPEEVPRLVDELESLGASNEAERDEL